jgi:hypothetical protein
MALAADDRHALARIESALRRSDPKLATMLATFNRLHQSERMPARELLPRPRPRLRLRGWVTRTGRWFSRWRLYPPVSPESRKRPSFRPAEVVSLVMATCALGVMVVLFTVLGHTRSAMPPARGGACAPTALLSCQPAARSAGTTESTKGAAG